jgi:hypothetical protein
VAGSLCYITPWRVNLGARRSSVRRISIPRVPVRKAKYHRLPACTNVDDGWFAFISRRMTPDWLNTKAKLVGGSLQAGSLCYLTPSRFRGGYERRVCRMISSLQASLRDADPYGRANPAINRRAGLLSRVPPGRSENRLPNVQTSAQARCAGVLTQCGAGAVPTAHGKELFLP